MIAFLSWVGQAVWPVVGLVPWGGPKFGLVLAALLAGVVAIGAPAGAVWLNMRGEVKVAVAQCQSACTLKIANMETAAERTIADILSSVNESGPASKDVAQYCERHPTLCRSER
ncbi:MAG TPA: hypothetical protein VFU31_29915 [Candidatus Binatia bacterium]|nr:hypothetical protein [Candidatus Binatia bacterium]